MTTMMLQLVEKLDLDGNIVGGVLEAACGHAHSLSSYDQSKVDLLVSSMLGLVEAVLGIPMLIVLVVPGGQELLYQHKCVGFHFFLCVSYLRK